MFPVYEFRPLPGTFRDPKFRRYANGEWIEDDGEFDLAFLPSLGSYETPICWMVEVPYQRYIRWSWTTGHWSAYQPGHPRGNAWHYMLCEGAEELGGDWGRDRHANYRVGRAGMDKLASERGCANGRHVEFHIGDRHIAAGLLREVESKRVVAFPEQLVCMYCGPLPYPQLREKEVV